jgi:hypothetical protein
MVTRLVPDEPQKPTVSAPSAEPASRAAKPEPEPQPEPQPKIIATTRQRRTREEPAEDKPTTRHDSEHGSVAARSVLDRLGIAAGSGGGRRRAADPGAPATAESRASEEPASPETPAVARTSTASEHGTTEPSTPVTPEPPSRTSVLEPESEPESAAPSPAESELEREPEQARTEQPAEENEPRAEVEPSDSADDNWLPRLRLPPSLAPFNEFPDDTPGSTSDTHFTNGPVIEDDGFGEPFRAERAGLPPEDDLPPDAGLADLLARALAEHQAGTSSAAALVKRLGSQDSEDPRPVNGHGGDAPGNGRHRGGS